MSQNQEQLDWIMQWLDACKGQSIRIEKQEQGDRDLTQLDLQGITFTHNSGNRYDDYIPGTELVLHGSGVVLSSEGNAALPRGQYEIPLAGEWHGDLQGGTLQVVTERGEYHISKP